MAAAYLLYGQMFSGIWLMDDFPVIVNNPDIRSFGNFLEDYYPGRPLRELSFLLDYTFFGLEPSGYYLQHIFWHGLCGWLVFRVVRQLGAAGPVAWVAALLFLFHPVQVEVVANNSHRKDSLALAFCLISFSTYLSARSVKPLAKRWLIVSALSWGAALLAKQNAVALPFVLAAYELSRLPRLPRRKALWVAGSLSVAGVVGRVVYLAQSPAFQAEIGPALRKLGYFQAATVEQYYLTVLKAWAHMGSKLLYPVDLSMEYTFAVPERWLDPWVLSGILTAVAVGSLFLWALRGSGVVFVALAWLLAFWLPTSNLLGFLSYFAADRYWYAPVVGVALLVAYGLWTLMRQHRSVFVVFCVVILSLLGWTNIQQQGVWCDEVTFHEHLHRVNPDALEGLIGLGNIAMSQGAYAKAAEYFRAAYLRSSQDARIPQSLGYLAYLQGQHERAVAYFQRAIALKPNLVEAYNNLGSLYDDLNQPEQAIAILQKALAVNAHYEKAYTNLGVVYERMGDLQKAEAMHRRALMERPDYGEAHYNLGNTLYHAGRKQEALLAYRQATRFAPELADAWFNYAVVANELGQRSVLPALMAKLRALDAQLAGQLAEELQ